VRMPAKGRLDVVGSSTMSPQGSETINLEVPAGEQWRILEIGLTDVGPPGQPGSSAQLLVQEGAAWKTVRSLAASNGTSPLAVERDFSEGTKLRLVRRNSAGQREVTAWVSGIVFGN